MREIKITRRTKNAQALVREALAQGRRVMACSRLRVWFPILSFEVEALTGEYEGGCIFWVTARTQYGVTHRQQVSTLRWQEEGR